VSFVCAQDFALQSVLKLSFLLVVLTISFGDAAKLFIVVYVFSLKKSDRLFAQLFSTYFKLTICH
jgi:hypothetical protein